MPFNWEMFNDLIERENVKIRELEAWLRDKRNYESVLSSLHQMKQLATPEPLNTVSDEITDINRRIREHTDRLDLYWLIRDLATTEKDPSK